MKHATIRKAAPADVPAITAVVCEAYVQYIERIGKRPGPMLEDFDNTVSAAQVFVAELKGVVVGVVVLKVTEEGFYLDNVAVRPTGQGTGVGRRGIWDRITHQVAVRCRAQASSNRAGCRGLGTRRARR